MSEGLNLENLLQLGITAAKEGNKDGARMLLRQVLEADRKNDRAWFWLAYLAETSDERRQYLENAVKANPKNQAAQQALRKMVAKRSNQEQRMLLMGIVVVLAISVVVALLCLVTLAAS
jgi:tetratricopeptide (TPR) repeat protein